MKQHTVPCRECPFRRRSLPGYLGSNQLEDFAAIAMTEERMPCHMRVDYDRSDWGTAQQTAPQCVGRATLWANDLKLPRDRDRVKAAPDRTNVFNNIREFLAHHDLGLEEEEEEELEA